VNAPGFWRLLLHSNVSFGSLSKAFKDMDSAEVKVGRCMFIQA
jgi:hypothetical protein